MLKFRHSPFLLNYSLISSFHMFKIVERLFNAISQNHAATIKSCQTVTFPFGFYDYASMKLLTLWFPVE